MCNYMFLIFFFFFNDTATTEIYTTEDTLSLHDALPISLPGQSLDIRLLVDRIPAFTWSAHPDGSVEFVNQRWREYAGLSSEESQGWGWQVAIHPEDLPS